MNRMYLLVTLMTICALAQNIGAQEPASPSKLLEPSKIEQLVPEDALQACLVGIKS